MDLSETKGGSMTFESDLTFRLRQLRDKRQLYARLKTIQIERYAGAFVESKHPRGQPENAGQFGPGGGGQKKTEPRKGFEPVKAQGAGKDRQFVHEHDEPLGADIAERAKSLKLPPAWINVQIAVDPKSPLQAIGYDTKGRAQYRYSSEHSEKQAAAKFERVKRFVGQLPKIRNTIESDLHSQNAADREAASVLYLIDKTGFRIGSERDTGAEKKAHGASTLTASHATVNGDSVTFSFVGKKGVDIKQVVHDKTLSRMIEARKKAGGKLFNTSDSDVRNYLHKTAGKFKVKDFRTAVAADQALQAISNIEAPKNDKEYEQRRKEVGKIVADKLGNTATVALASYIPPEVFSKWQANLTKTTPLKSSSKASATTSVAKTGSQPTKTRTSSSVGGPPKHAAAGANYSKQTQSESLKTRVLRAIHKTQKG